MIALSGPKFRPPLLPGLLPAVLGLALGLVLAGCGSSDPDLDASALSIPDADPANDLTLVAVDESSTTTANPSAVDADSASALTVDGSTVEDGATASSGPDQSTSDGGERSTTTGSSGTPTSSPTSSTGNTTVGGSQVQSSSSAASGTSAPTSTSQQSATSASTGTSPTTAATTPTTSKPTTATTRATTTTAAPSATPAVLIFSKTAGYRHPAIGTGVATMKVLAQSEGFQVTTSEDAGLFTDASLAGFDAVVFMSTSGDILNSSQQAAFESFIGDGGGFVGVHAASDTEYGWSWYGGLVGAYFSDHPLVPNNEFVDCHCFNAEVRVSASHGSTSHLPSVWNRRDEWYNFRSAPSGVQVLLDLDESTYSGGTMGSSHPISWSHEYSGGRSWYTAMGHTPESYTESNFKKHLIGGLLWAAAG